MYEYLVSGMRRKKMRRKGIILSQNMYFHPAIRGFAPWNPHQGSVSDTLGGLQCPKPPAAKGPQFILCPAFQFSKAGKYRLLVNEW